MAADGSSGETQPGEGIPNFDSVKATIRAYYNAPDGIANKHSSPLHHRAEGPARQVGAATEGACANQVAYGNRPAVVFDADDTTLWTYDMEDDAHGVQLRPCPAGHVGAGPSASRPSPA